MYVAVPECSSGTDVMLCCYVVVYCTNVQTVGSNSIHRKLNFMLIHKCHKT